ncbi:Na+/H+ antiporter NhaC family protein [Paenarthrobacter sp. NPDC089675]|uniref:Na+/H+ antiporter NhaC family protein n=1 Tax=Paenarthrobacter sp. NPDC089675 TaxID=3364376 RepID=UPI003801DF29
MSNENLAREGTRHFHGGALGALLPFIVFVSGIVYLTTTGDLSSATGGAIAFVSFLFVFLLMRNKAEFTGIVFRGLKNDMLVMLLVSFLLAGVMAKTLEMGGLISALVWGATALNIQAWMVPVILFLIVTLIGLATGTNAGTIVTTLPILLPLGISLDVNPGLVVGAIVGGAMWGDNVAPISDTTIVSAATQETSVSRVVKSRLKYAGVAGAMAIVGYVVLGIVLPPVSGGGAEVAAQDGNPMALILLSAPAIIIFLMLRGKDIIFALSIATFFSLALALGTGLIQPAQIVASKGVIVTGFTGMMGIFPFFLFLFVLIEALRFAGAIEWIGMQALKISKTPRTAEGMSALVASATYMVTTVHSVSVVVSGPIVRSIMCRFNVDRARAANIIDCIVSGLHGVMPHSAVTVIAMGIVAQSAWVPKGFTALDYLPYVLPSLFLLVVFAVAIITGWGRRKEMSDDDFEADLARRDALDQAALQGSDVNS